MSIRLKKLIKAILIYLASILLAIITAGAVGSIPLNVSNPIAGYYLFITMTFGIFWNLDLAHNIDGFLYSLDCRRIFCPKGKIFFYSLNL